MGERVGFPLLQKVEADVTASLRRQRSEQVGGP